MPKLSEKEAVEYMEQKGYQTRSRCTSSDGTQTFNMVKEFYDGIYIFAEVQTKNNFVTLSFMYKMIHIKTSSFSIPHALFEKVFEKQMLTAITGALSAFQQEV